MEKIMNWWSGLPKKKQIVFGAIAVIVVIGIVQNIFN